MIYHILTPLPLEFLPKTASRSMIIKRFAGDHLAPVKRSKITYTKTLFRSRALPWLLCVILYYPPPPPRFLLLLAIYLALLQLEKFSRTPRGT